MTSKVVVLVDGGYFDHLNYYLKDKRGKVIDIEKLSLKVVGEDEHIRTRFYHANPYQSKERTDEEKQKFQNAQKFQYRVNLYPNHEFVAVGRVRPYYFYCSKCKENSMIPKQKGVDVALALDLVKMARKKVADIFVLISGDEDLASAVEMAQGELCNVVVFFTFDRDYGIYGSKKLGNVASNRVNMDLDFLEECAMD